MRTLSMLLLFSLLGSHTLSAQDVPSDPAKFHLFLLAGQSNMAGRGTVEAEDQQPHRRVLMLNKEGEFVPAIDPLHFDKPKVAGVGLGKTFAMDYAEAHPGVTVGLIPCAVGGSPISSWQVGAEHTQTKTHPYDDCVQRMMPVLGLGTLKGILWHQGESDSNQGASAVYEQRLIELAARMRKQFDAADVPFIVGQMGRFDGRTWNEYREAVDAVHQGVAAIIPRSGFASAEGLSHRGDHLHFNSASMRELGHRYFQAFQRIVSAGQ